MRGILKIRTIGPLDKCGAATKETYYVYGVHAQEL